jgi:hypothetical protein
VRRVQGDARSVEIDGSSQTGRLRLGTLKKAFLFFLSFVPCQTQPAIMSCASVENAGTTASSYVIQSADGVSDFKPRGGSLGVCLAVPEGHLLSLDNWLSRHPAPRISQRFHKDPATWRSQLVTVGLAVGEVWLSILIGAVDLSARAGRCPARRYLINCPAGVGCLRNE